MTTFNKNFEKGLRQNTVAHFLKFLIKFYEILLLHFGFDFFIFLNPDFSIFSIGIQKNINRDFW